MYKEYTMIQLQRESTINTAQARQIKMLYANIKSLTIMKNSHAKNRSNANTANVHSHGIIFSSYSYTMKSIHFHYYFKQISIKLINIDLNYITFRKAIANIIDVTNTPSPTRNEKRANITRIFRTKDMKKFNTYYQLITVKLGFKFFTMSISNVNKFVRYKVITVMSGPWCSH